MCLSRLVDTFRLDGEAIETGGRLDRPMESMSMCKTSLLLTPADLDLSFSKTLRLGFEIASTRVDNVANLF